jgi:hypothetical protein
MALDGSASPSGERHRDHVGPLGASLRWGLGWTIVVATLGATAGCVSATPVEAPAPVDDSSTNSTTSHEDHYSDCVDALGGMPDAAEHHIDACAVASAAGAFSR